ncbi:MAG TPA: hypothetical protein PLR87_02295 [Thermoanaerobaculaceae bacterium]|nr:hypothetical protein [Thermoanaerobaculaceae bacterium]
MTIGIVPQAIHEATSSPTHSMMRIAGSALRMLSTIPCCISFQVRPTPLAVRPVTTAAAISSTCALIAYTP